LTYKYIIIDAQNLYWRSVFASLKKLLDKEDDKIYSNSIRDFLDRINDLKNRFGNFESYVYLLFDNPLSIINKRKTIDVEYKNNRDEKHVPKNFYKTLDCLQEILKVYKNNLYIVRYDGLEADDLLYPVLQEIDEKSKQEKKIVISADMDWGRCLGVDENCEWFNFATVYDRISFKEHYGFNPAGKAIQMYKSIHGDNSDAIPNAVPRIPKDILIDIVENFNSVDDLFNSMWNYSGIPSQWTQKIKEAEKRIRINYRLVDFIVYEKLNNFIFDCKENIKMLRFWFELNDLQFENRMFDKSKDSFFEKAKYRRIKK
jgi:hypothetical protein